MAKYQITNRAVGDLAQIWNYTRETWSEEQADRYYRMLTDFFEAIARSPESGRKYPQVMKDLYGHRAGRHIIFYEWRNNQVVIIRILHEQMDLKNRLHDK